MAIQTQGLISLYTTVDKGYRTLSTDIRVHKNKHKNKAFLNFSSLISVVCHSSTAWSKFAQKVSLEGVKSLYLSAYLLYSQKQARGAWWISL
ncbi:hypothetical protein, partial [Pseudomonas sp.]|uniref:hypothetical protein n=1 Tax=Pseudomonas sp. TaxID=306 RepID=UPI0028AB051A